MLNTISGFERGSGKPVVVFRRSRAEILQEWDLRIVAAGRSHIRNNANPAQKLREAREQKETQNQSEISVSKQMHERYITRWLGSEVLMAWP